MAENVIALSAALAALVAGSVVSKRRVENFGEESSWETVEGSTQMDNIRAFRESIKAATPNESQLRNASGSDMFTMSSDKSGLQGSAINFDVKEAMGGPTAPAAVSSKLLPASNPSAPSWESVDLTALKGQNFLTPTQRIGTDTVMSSNRNSSRDLRNILPNPVRVVSPWMNSTITPDLERRPLN